MNISFKKPKLRSVMFYLGISVLFVLVLYWLFSSTGHDKPSEPDGSMGLNTFLPAANLANDSSKDKLSFYDEADADSVKRIEQIRMDPNREDQNVSAIALKPDRIKIESAGNFRYALSAYDNNRLAEKLHAVQESLNANQTADQTERNQKFSDDQGVTKPHLPDPEMEQINAALDKVMTIQYPKADVNKGYVNSRQGLIVTSDHSKEPTYFGKEKIGERNGKFYGDENSSIQTFPELTAAISNEQEVQTGSVVRMELRTPMRISNTALPIGTPIFGIASVETERLQIHISSIRYRGVILPASLDIFDIDGIQGIYSPGSLVREAAKGLIENTGQSVGVLNGGLSLQSQAVAAGIGAAKGLLSKKVKQVRIKIPAGYRLTLRDSNSMIN